MDLRNDLSERIGKLLYDATTSDVTLIVEGECIPAHKLILISSSDYFRYLTLRRGNDFVTEIAFIDIHTYITKSTQVYTSGMSTPKNHMFSVPWKGITLWKHERSLPK